MHQKTHLLSNYYVVLPEENRILIDDLIKYLFTSASGEPNAGIVCLLILLYKSWNFLRRSNSYRLKKEGKFERIR